MARAADFLRQNPVPSSGRRFAARPTDCDTCRIMDILIANNYTLTLQGDSVMGQVFWGLECDLLRRGYNVAAGVWRHDRGKAMGWRYGLRDTYFLRVSFPNRTNTAVRGNNPRSASEATVLLRFMYRPPLDMQNVTMLAEETDILVFDHGLHYGARHTKEMMEFETSTTGILAAARNSTRTKLVAWRETTPQHYNTSGGQ
jgi:hypothetical protein